MGMLAKGSGRNFSRLIESPALGTEFPCTIVSSGLISVVGQLAYSMLAGMPLNYTAPFELEQLKFPSE